MISTARRASGKSFSLAPQFARPTADVALNGWTVTPSGTGAAALDDVSDNDTDFIQVGNTGGTVGKFTLGAISNPGGGSAFILVRAKTSSGGTVSASLVSTGGGSVYVPSTSVGSLTASFADYTLNLSGAQMAAIANWGALELWLTGVADVLNSVSVSMAYFGTS